MSRAARDVVLEGWEKGDFPIACETCLGDNPAIRMVKAAADKECKICNRPCTTFRWQPGRHARHKSTIICQMCARQKNVCQVCLFDLQYGLPVQVRDRFLEGAQNTAGGGAQQALLDIPISRVNRDYQVNRQEASGQIVEAGFDKAAIHPVLQKLARVAPYYERNRARVCTFWLRGECNRGDGCPFRHEKDQHDPTLANQKIRDRYYGINDPVANKIMKRAEESKRILDEQGNSIVAEPHSENRIRVAQYSGHGDDEDRPLPPAPQIPMPGQAATGANATPVGAPHKIPASPPPVALSTTSRVLRAISGISPSSKPGSSVPPPPAAPTTAGVPPPPGVSAGIPAPPLNGTASISVSVPPPPTGAASQKVPPPPVSTAAPGAALVPPPPALQPGVTAVPSPPGEAEILESGGPVPVAAPLTTAADPTL